MKTRIFAYFMQWYRISYLFHNLFHTTGLFLSGGFLMFSWEKERDQWHVIKAKSILNWINFSLSWKKNMQSFAKNDIIKVNPNVVLWLICGLLTSNCAVIYYEIYIINLSLMGWILRYYREQWSANNKYIASAKNFKWSSSFKQLCHLITPAHTKWWKETVLSGTEVCFFY